MEKLRMHSPDLTQSNIDKVAELFPTVVTETRTCTDTRESHTHSRDCYTKAIDFDMLRQELSDHVVEGPQERYQLDWPGKREALFAANAPIAKTLRPVREESVNFDTTKNIFIEGDNLDALKLLQESYLGKVKLIYIDPPYNTGNDFVYADTFAASKEEELRRSGQTSADGVAMVTNPQSTGRFHSNWLSMIYPRLKLARNLLSDDGVLVVSIDENEHASLVRTGEEVLGNFSYVGEIVLKNSSKNDQSYISIQHEYIVFFVKNRDANPGNWTERKEGLDKIFTAFEAFRKEHGSDWDAIHEAATRWYRSFPASDPIAASKHYNWLDERGVYFASDISGPNHGQYVYDVVHPSSGRVVTMPASGWRYPEDEMLRRIAQQRVHFGDDHTSVPKNKTYLSDTEYQSLASIRYVDGRGASRRLQSLFGEKVFTNPKDEFLLRDIYRAVGVSGSDTVLDMFAGSGSAMQAVLELNRATGSTCTYIGLQVAEDLRETLKTARGAAKQITTNAIRYLARLGRAATVAEITKQRMRLVHERLHADILTDSGLRVLRTDTTNMADLLRTPDEQEQGTLTLGTDPIRPGRTPEDLLFQVLLDWGLSLDLPIERVALGGAEVFDVDAGTLIACFDDTLSLAVIRAIAERTPVGVAVRDSAFADDSARINAEQIFREVSPDTVFKAI